MLFREKEALFYDRRVILYSVQVFGSLGRNGVKNTCTAILGVFFIDFNPSIGFVTMVFTGLKKQLVLIRFLTGRH